EHRSIHSFPTRRSSDLFKDDLPDVKEIGQKRNQKEDQDFQYLKKVLLGFVTLIVVFFVIWIILLQIGSEGDLFESKKIYDVGSRSEEHTSELQSRFDLV